MLFILKFKTILTKQFFLNIFCCSLLKALQNVFSMCKSCHKLCNAKNWVAIRFTWQNEPYYIKANYSRR